MCLPASLEAERSTGPTDQHRILIRTARASLQAGGARIAKASRARVGQLPSWQEAERPNLTL